MAVDPKALPKPARYFPIEKGLYEVAPGLRSLGTALGNGERDALVFQLDSEFARYRANKMACRLERLGKYHCTSRYAPDVSTAVNRFLVKQLMKEYPGCFSWKAEKNGGGALECLLTQEVLELDAGFELVGQSGVGIPGLRYVNALDALACQFQEDIAVMNSGSSANRAPGGESQAAPARLAETSLGEAAKPTVGAAPDWLSAIHLCSPGHWAAEDKIGKSFFDIHVPVAGIEKINRAASSFVDAMINKGPYVRFVWGFGTDKRLNHHPIPAAGADAAEWKGRSFRKDREGSPFILRVERQVTVGLPAVNAAIFLIRVYFIDGDEIRRNPKERAQLRAGLLSMTPESRVYKGLDQCMDEVIAWLDDAGQ